MNKTTTPKTDAVLLVNPKQLKPHPLIKDLPLLEPEHPQYHALLNSVRDGRILEPLKIDQSYQVLDGRHRLQVALDLSLNEVPCLIYPEDEAGMIAFDTLVARKHYTAGTLAYMHVGWFETLLNETRERTNQNLKNAKTPTIYRKPITRTSGKNGVEKLARERGFSDDTLRQARELHEAFRKNPELKEIWEPKLLNGEIGLGRLLEGIGSSLATKGKKRKLKDFTKVFATARGNIRYFVARATELDRGQLLHHAAELGDEIAKLPDIAVATIAKRLKKS